MSHIVNEFINAKKALLWYFNCREDYFVKILDQAEWRVDEEEDIYFLSYLEQGGDSQHAVIVKKDGEPLIYLSPEHTLVVAIDCVKTAFIFDNKNKVDD